MTTINNAVYVASEVVSGDPGLVTASLLYDYMESFKQSLATSPIDWDVPSVNIKCEGKNIISTSADKVTFGDDDKLTDVKGTFINLRAVSEVSLYGTQMFANFSHIGLSGSSISLNATSKVGLYAPEIEPNPGGSTGDPTSIDWDVNNLSIRYRGSNVISFDGNKLIFGDLNTSAELRGTGIDVKGGTVISLYADNIDLTSWGAKLNAYDRIEMTTPNMDITSSAMNLTATRIAMHADEISPAPGGGSGENPTSIDWDLEDLNIRYRGQNVLSAVNDQLRVGNINMPTGLYGINVDVESGTKLSLYAREFIGFPGSGSENPASIDWDLDSLNIKCRGKNVISSDYGDVTIGNRDVTIQMDGANVIVNPVSMLEVHAGGMIADINSYYSLNVNGPLSLTSSNSGIELYGDVRLMTPKQYTPTAVVRHLGITDPESDKEVVYF